MARTHAVVIVTLAVTCGVLAWQFVDQRAQIREQAVLISARDLRIGELEQAQSQSKAAAKGARENAGTAAAPAAKAPGSTTPPASAPEARFDRSRRLEQLPAMRPLRQATWKLMIWRNYGPVVAQLSLTADEEDRLIDMLAIQLDRRQDIWRQDGEPRDRAFREQLQAAMEREELAEVETLLGAERTSAYREYEQTLGPRLKVSHLGEQLGARDVPLNADQRKALISIVAEENKRVAAPSMPDGAAAEDMKRRLNWIDDLDRRIRERANGTLSSQQLKVLAQEQRLQSANRWASFELQKQERAAGLGVGIWHWPGD